jgi:DNA-binding beta-propeller fold protein YncE
VSSRAALLALAWSCLSETNEPLVLDRKVPLPGVEGRFDHFAVDLKAKRLYVAALGNDSLEAIALDEGKHAGRASGLKEPQGVLVLPDTGEVAVASGGDGTLKVFDGPSLKLLRTLEVGDDADNVRLDSATKRIYVACARALAVVDSANWKKAGEIPLESHAESFQLEKNGKRLFANVPAAKQIAVIDREKGAVIARWSLEGAEANFPMALDEAGHRLLTGCRTPPRIIVLDTDTGKQKATIDCSGDMDDLFYDAASKRVLASCGEGFIDVFELIGPDRYERIAKLTTAPGARTSLVVPDLRILGLAVPHRGDQTAEVRIFKLAK